MFWPQKPAALLIQRSEALSQGPRARALKGLGPGGPGHLVFFKTNSGSALCSGRGLVLCAGVLSYVQGSKSYVQGSKSYVQGSKSYVQESKSYVQGQTLVTLFFYGVNALWRQPSMAWALYGVKALWRERSMTWTLYDVNALWRECSVPWALYAVSALWSSLGCLDIPHMWIPKWFQNHQNIIPKLCQTNERYAKLHPKLFQSNS